MSAQFLVHKLDEHGHEVWSYLAVMLERTPSFIRLEARFDREDRHVGSLLLRQHDTFIETFFFDRWYNVFEVFDPETERFKGWYCNITRPAWVEDNHLFAEDLALDLVATADGHVEILDQDEFDRLEISAEDREQAIKTLHSLKSQAITRSGIFTDHTRA